MPRFSVGDKVLLLDKFARSYSGHVGTVVKVKVDMLRTLFDEYTLEFSDQSTGTFFDFQIIEDSSKYRDTTVAVVTFDSNHQKPSMPLRGSAAARQILLQTDDADIHLRISSTAVGTMLFGQILGKDPDQFPPEMEVRLLQDTRPIDVATTNSLGEFRFGNVPHGALNLEILLRANLSRIVGTFTI
jgi:hypothetical protein